MLSYVLTDLRLIFLMILFCGCIVLYLLFITSDDGNPIFATCHLDSLQKFRSYVEEMAIRTPPPVAVAANNGAAPPSLAR